MYLQYTDYEIRSHEYPMSLAELKNARSVSFGYLHNTKYAINDIITINNYNELNFYIICNIIYISDENELLVITKKMVINNFNSHINAHVVQTSNNKIIDIFKLKNITYLPTKLYNLVYGKVIKIKPPLI